MIKYGITKDGYIVSKKGDYFAWPVLEYEKMTPENEFEITYTLEKVHTSEVIAETKGIKWTNKIPEEMKELHKEFWMEV